MQKAVKIYVEFYSFFAYTISRNEQYIKEGVESIWEKLIFLIMFVPLYPADRLFTVSNFISDHFSLYIDRLRMGLLKDL